MGRSQHERKGWTGSRDKQDVITRSRAWRMDSVEPWHRSRTPSDEETNLNNDLAFQECVMVLNVCRIFY